MPWEKQQLLCPFRSVATLCLSSEREWEKWKKREREGNGTKQSKRGEKTGCKKSAWFDERKGGRKEPGWMMKQIIWNDIYIRGELRSTNSWSLEKHCYGTWVKAHHEQREMTDTVLITHLITPIQMVWNVYNVLLIVLRFSMFIKGSWSSHCCKALGRCAAHLQLTHTQLIQRGKQIHAGLIKLWN